MAFVLGMGNALLDITATVDEAFLKKFNVEMGSARLSTPADCPALFDALTQHEDVKYTAGGATLNSIRVCQWLCGQEGFTAYMGCVAKDKFGTLLKDHLELSGVKGYWKYDDTEVTGTCAVCISDKERGMVANLAAANKYHISHFEANASVARRARIIYSAGYFLTVSPETAYMAAQITEETGALFATDLAAEFICEFFKDQQAKAISYSDIVFGNELEAAKYAKVHGVKDATVAGAAKYIAALPHSKKNGVRTVVFTQGSLKTVVARSDGLYMEVPVKKLDRDRIVDLNAAGDSFVGGFLAGLCKNKSVLECVEMGHQAARFVIQRSGCDLPGMYASQVDHN